jgi:uroporphyrinogen decarboxylase
MTSMQRVQAVLSRREPDRVPLFLPLTMHGAQEVGMPLGQYYSSSRAVAEGQLRLRAKYADDIVYTFFYAGIEYQAFGGEVEFFDDGPPNAICPLISRAGLVRELSVPRVSESLPLARVLAATEQLAHRLAGTAPILGVVMSPYSLPVMQLGFAQYITALREEPALMALLIEMNEEFTVAWANAQLAAGATAVAYFDPLASADVVSREVFHRVGLPVMHRTISAIKGPRVTMLASASVTDVLEDLLAAPAAMINVGVEDDLAAVKAATRGRAAIVGNLNSIQMRRWTPQQAQQHVRSALAAAGPGGGFLLSDCHGEIPTQVSGEVLGEIVAAVAEFGRYPMSG